MTLLQEIELIKDNLNLEALLDYLKISYQSLEYELKFLCPFHREKTPSMFLNKEKLWFNCFGCGESGDIIKFVMNLLGLSFKDALSFLKEFLGSSYKKSIEGKIYRTKKIQRLQLDTFLPINDSLYPDYLKNRGVNLETAKHFELGICFIGNFKDRIIIPIKYRNRNVAYIGRDITGANKLKYLNLGRLNKVLYNNIEDEKECYIVEGVFDVWQMYQANFKNCIGTFGNLLTDIQKSTLMKKNKIMIVPDSGEAGDVLIKELKFHSNLYIGRLPKEYHDAGETPLDILKSLVFEKYKRFVNINTVGILRK